MLPHLLAVLTSPAITAQPVELDTIRPADAVPLNGRYVRATFTVASPPDHTEFITVLGYGSDEVERRRICRRIWASTAGTR